LISASSQSGELVSGTELDRLGDEALQARLATASVFCRVQPEQKLRLVQALQARGDVVAMTGDGVNDAPALKAADIGVAMGARGTDVAREAAALVLLDDDFTSLVTAVRHGRRVFANLRKAIAFVVAVHVPIVGLSVLPVLMGWPVLLMPVHILSLQLVIDPACAFVFEAEPMADDTMRRPPRSTRAQLFDRLTVVCGVWQGGGLLVMLLGVFAGVQALGQSADMARGLTFLVLVLSNLALIQVNRTGDQRSWPGSAHGSRALSWVTLVTVFGLALSLSVPSWARLFAFERPTPALATAALGLVLLSYLWFELVKRVLGSRSHTTFRINPSSA
jgi:Ca2+-transporting ATPase